MALNLEKQIWKDKAKGEVNPLAFSELAQKLAHRISEEGGGPRGRKNKSTQLRKYYDAIFNLNQRAKSQIDETKWNAILAQLHRQLALVHYSKGRDLVTDSFVSMMDELIKAVNTWKDLQVITDFLEAFMAYYKECRPRN